MSLIKRLVGIFSGAKADADAQASGPSEEHAGYIITATPYEANGRWQLCGVISREVDGVVKEHKFIRADNFGSRSEAEEMVLFKGRQIIDQSGGRLFGEG